MIDIARPLAGLLPVDDLREPLRAIIASLAPGGAERIVLDWLGAEAALGRRCELAVVHARRIALAPPPGVTLLARGNESPQTFLRAVAARWQGAHAPISAHLISDAQLALFWEAGLATVPVVHNMPQGWRNDPAHWRAPAVPQAIACAGAVGEAMRAHGCRVPVVVLRHRPAVAPAAFDATERARIRAALGIVPTTLMVLAVGAFKPQKDYPRAVRVCAAAKARRALTLVIAGGAADSAGLAQLEASVDVAMNLGFEDHLRLPGFVIPIAPYLSAADVLLNVSAFEGLSMAVREALAAGLPVIATTVGGQQEIVAPGLHLVPADAGDDVIAALLAGLPVRARPAAAPENAAPHAARAWSLPLAWRSARCESIDTLFVTANLNAGGAQRSLVNLAGGIGTRQRIAVAVCGESTQEDFARQLAHAGVAAFRPAETRDPLALAESLIAWATAHGVRAMVFWNADARLKLALARFAPAALRLIDVSPGAYAFEELAAAASWAEAIDSSTGLYADRLDVLVHKYQGATTAWQARNTVVIPNGVALRAARSGLPVTPRFIVSGRIASSKRIEVILEAFAGLATGLPQAELHVVGHAEERDASYASTLARRAEGLRAVWRGACPELEFLGESWTAAVVLGTHQGSPNAVLEAMAAGIPVIANASGGTGEIVIDGANGWLLPEHCTADELRDAMREAAREAALNCRLGAAARDFVARRHALPRMVDAYMALLGGAMPVTGDPSQAPPRKDCPPQATRTWSKYSKNAATSVTPGTALASPSAAACARLRRPV
ncbi:MAG: glycosyltransferase [Burkholderiales bacterium]|nr:glycosyltransferase [Burkholderiales bacterium]